MGCAKRLFLLLPSLLGSMPPAMPWIFACILDLPPPRLLLDVWQSWPVWLGQKIGWGKTGWLRE